MYSTGNQIVDESASINISGNIIPQTWYKTIVKESGKPHLTAIVILADIVYWYKPTEVRDEGTGQVIALKKKFKADLLQRSYQQISEEFGISKKEATNAVVFLEKLGVLKRVFRKLNINGLVLSNVLFLELNVKKLRELTYPVGSKTTPIPSKRHRVTPEKDVAQQLSSETSNSHIAVDGGVPFKSDRVLSIKVAGQVPPEEGIALSQAPPDHWFGETNTENTPKTIPLDFSNPIPSYQEIKSYFKEQIGYDAIWNDRPIDRERLEEIVSNVVEVLTSTADTIRINREDKPLDVVKSVYWKLGQFHIEYVLDSLKQSETKAHNIRAVILTALYNATMTMGHYYTNLVHSNQMAVT